MHTNVWHYFPVVSGDGGRWQNVWVWAGAVNTDQDPPVGLPHC
ncbi:hypothetical protein [Streptomyces sp. NPDC051572]